MAAETCLADYRIAFQRKRSLSCICRDERSFPDRNGLLETQEEEKSEKGPEKSTVGAAVRLGWFRKQRRKHGSGPLGLGCPPARSGLGCPASISQSLRDLRQT